jgi:hypothetical protein
VALHRHFRIPFYYRAHNVEHRYFRHQASVATEPLRRLALTLARLHLYRHERRIIDAAADVLWISVDDQAFWRARGAPAGQWLPPLPDCAGAAEPPDADGEVRTDICFLGNLNTPNNVAGIAWLIGAVMPAVWAARPQTSLTIAGSRPTDRLRQIVAADPRIRLLENVAEPARLFATSRVLANPALGGSGVNVKSLDMLLSGRPVVSTPQGAAGLPQDIRDLFALAADPHDFARALLDRLTHGAADPQQRARVLAVCSMARIREIVMTMRAASRGAIDSADEAAP